MQARFIVSGIVVACALSGMAQTTSRVIFPDDLDQWKARVIVGRPGNYSFAQGPAAEGGIYGSGHLAFDKDGNMYSACGTFIQMVTKDGTVRVLAGTPGIGGCSDGTAAQATFAGAVDMAMSGDGKMYVIDEPNVAVRLLEKQADGWHVSTVAGVPGQRGHRDGPAGQALYDTTFHGIAIGDDGVVYTMDGNWLRKLDKGAVTTLNAGTGYANGPLAQARFNRAMGGVPCLSFGNHNDLYVADRWNQAIRKVDLNKGEVTTYAGAEPGAAWGGPFDGPALQARFHGGGGPCQVLYLRRQDFLLAKAADEDNPRIIRDGRMMTFGFTGGTDLRRPAEGPIRALIGGYATPAGEDSEGNIYIGNGSYVGQMIRKVSK